ncbi:DNA-binding domain-containing protein [Paenibacillus aceris]|uniref:Two-component system response regulator YcbB n=1 Tax=Paenibacillus aceris TaxID=869555 RepID=A0ABS4HWP1_9BACL|nr:DNA-binding domain-containing protein [Paenibacillus aceris]MBP1963067.1 two-component system response regulator YcbB [Paenibacillus aceris]NHW39040.1 response regulator [Paenibacillus aceris]
MRFFIIDDDPAIRSMLEQIIEDEDLGSVVGEASDGAHVDIPLLELKQVDIMLIDLLMPVRDGIETVRKLSGSFEGKIIMISQVESKEMIVKAYASGIEYYITKPINRLEVIAVIRKVSELLLIHQSFRNIQKSLRAVGFSDALTEKQPSSIEKNIITCGNYMLSDLGLIGEAGSKDLLEMLDYLYRYEADHSQEQGFPQLHEIYHQIALKKLGPSASTIDLKKEIKAAEQRVRRAVNQALTHLASLGLIDYSNPKFEQYSTKFFDLSDIRKKMKALENDESSALSLIRQNTKKFIQVLYLESRKLMS